MPWAVPLSITSLFPLLLGPVSHHLFWIHGDWDGTFYLIAFSAFLLHNTLALLLPFILFLTTTLIFSTYISAHIYTHLILFHVELLYTLSTLLSISLYRLFFHPLSPFPGPTLSRLTIFHRVSLTLRSNHRHALVLQSLHAQYGDIVRVGPTHLSILSASSVDTIHGKGSQCTKGAAYENPMGRCVNWDRDPKSHAERRRVWDQALGREARGKYFDRIRVLTELLVARFAESCETASSEACVLSDGSGGGVAGGENTATSVNEHVHRFAVDVMASLCFSLPYGYGQLLHNTTHLMVRVIQKYMLIGVYATMVPWLHCCVSRLWVPDTWVKQWDWMFFDFAKREMERRRDYRGKKEKDQEGVREERRDGKELKEDIMGYLLLANRGNGKNMRKLSFEELVTDTLIMTVGGSDTTNSALVHTLYRLAKHQDVQEKVYEEVIRSCPKGDRLEMEMLKNLAYLTAFVHEVLRLHPPAASGLPRVVPKGGLLIDGHLIPEGTNVITPTYALQRDERYFVAAEKFMPERWTSQRYLVKDARAFCPFGIGVYGCPGKSLAMLEMKIVLASIVRDLRVRIPEELDEEELEGRVERGWRDCLTTQPAELELCFERR